MAFLIVFYPRTTFKYLSNIGNACMSSEVFKVVSLIAREHLASELVCLLRLRTFKAHASERGVRIRTIIGCVEKVR